ncbi:MAG: hypothetical protein KBT39_00610, partial [Bacteroidales bacterium]|nr:hypothetical protein [Bacteroidales bacterium]
MKRLIGILMIVAGLNALAATVVSNGIVSTPTEAPADTTSQKKPKYTVRKTDKETTEDLKQKTADLRDPDNVQTEVSYDEKNDTYTIGTALNNGSGTGSKNGARGGSNAQRNNSNTQRNNSNT